VREAGIHPAPGRVVLGVLLPARICGALLVLATGGLHLYLYFYYFHTVHVVGTLFLLNAAAGTAIGVWLLVSSHPLAAAAGVGFAAATLTFFFISVYHGLFGFTESLWGDWQKACMGVELAAIAVLAPVLIAEVRARSNAASLPGTARARHREAVPSRTRS
jgi:hypothetical protein